MQAVTESEIFGDMQAASAGTTETKATVFCAEEDEEWVKASNGDRAAHAEYWFDVVDESCFE